MFKSVMRAASQLDETAANGISNYLLGQINDDGGFRGRAQASDLYYTVFGMTALSALGVEFSLDRSWNYLGNFGDGANLDFIHLTCLARCRAICRFMGDGMFPETSDDALIIRMEEFRAACGGYNHTAKGMRKGTVYAAFLAYCAYEDCGTKIPAMGDMLGSVEGLKCAGGGYSNDESILSGTTTATAAAMVLHHKAGAGTDDSTVNWLLNRCTARGGFLAGEHARMPDLLSTGTALHALKTVGATPGDRTAACRKFIDLLWMEDGGFAGTPADLTIDCEYTFYALLGLGSLD